MSLLRYVPPMGIYQTLYSFLESFGTYMGEPGTHPWSQGFPRTDQLPGGPPMPASASIDSTLLKYPKAWGYPPLREAIAGYYREAYGSDIDAENVMVFAGGRPAIMAILLFLERDVTVRIASTEYTPYYDMLEGLGRAYDLVASHAENGFRPTVGDYVSQEGVSQEGVSQEGVSQDGRSLAILSNPCNPTAITHRGDALGELVRQASDDGHGLLIDEAYELFHDQPTSALGHIRDIDATNVFVVGAATKGLQAPGIRIGWVVSSKRHIEILSNFSSFGMGGVSHLSQCYARDLLEPTRVASVRKAVPAFYRGQRERYGEAFEKLGLELFSGDGGFYHWCRLPGGATAQALNELLYAEGAAILKGTDCDMARGGDQSTLRNFFRFSFGPLAPESFDADIAILRRALDKL